MLFRLSWILAALPLLAAQALAGECARTLDLSLPLETKTYRFTDSVVWNLKMGEARPEVPRTAEVEDRISVLISKVAELMERHADSGSPGFMLTQDDIGALSQFAHEQRYKFAELVEAKHRIEKAWEGKKGYAEIMEGQRFLGDLAYVRGRMDELETFGGMRCYFAYGAWLDRALNNPDSRRVYKEHRLDEVADRRAVVGQCWDRTRLAQSGY